MNTSKIHYFLHLIYNQISNNLLIHYILTFNNDFNSVISENGNSCIDKYITTDLPVVYTSPASLYMPTPVTTSTLTYGSSRRMLMSELFESPPCKNSSTSQTRRLTTTGDGGSSDVNTTSKSNDTTTTITYVFYGNAETDSADSIDSTIQKKMAALDSTSTATDFSLKSNLLIFIHNYTGTTFPNVTSGVYNGLINTITPAFATYPPIEVSVGVKWIAMIDVSLESSGYVYAVAVKAANSTPNAIQIKHGLDAYDQIAASIQSARFETDTVKLNFTGLTSKVEYDIFYYATNDDISRFAITTSIVKITATTETATSIDLSSQTLTMSWTLLMTLLVALLNI